MDTQFFLDKMPEGCRPSKVGTLTIEQYDQRRADTLNATPGELSDGIECPECQNKGYIAAVRAGGGLYTRECPCMIRRRNNRILKASGLENLVQRYRFDTWETPEKWQSALLRMGQEYADNPRGWLYLTGRPGTGKTHLCTAVCAELMDRGFPVLYLLWRDFSVTAKAVVNDSERYAALVEPAKLTQVLYIDDFFKTGSRPTAGDINLAFEVINFRYNDDAKITLISSERTAEDLCKIDEALGSRIYERSKDYYADLTNKLNFRIARA